MLHRFRHNFFAKPFPGLSRRHVFGAVFYAHDCNAGLHYRGPLCSGISDGTVNVVFRSPFG